MQKIKKYSIIMFLYLVIVYLTYSLFEKSLYFYDWDKDSIKAYAVILTILMFGFIYNLINRKDE